MMTITQTKYHLYQKTLKPKVYLKRYSLNGTLMHRLILLHTKYMQVKTKDLNPHLTVWYGVENPEDMRLMRALKKNGIAECVLLIRTGLEVIIRTRKAPLQHN